MEVRKLSNPEMRMAFGVRFNPKLGRHGLTVNYVDYQGDYLEQRWFAKGNENFEVRYWHGDIGTIEVRPDNGEWTTVTAKDERWIGKTEADLREWLMKRREFDPEAEEAPLWVIHEIDQRSKAPKAMNSLFARPRSKDGVELTEAHFARHTDTAERRYLSGPHRDLLEDVVEIDDGARPLPHLPGTATDTGSDLLDDDFVLE